MKLRLIVVLLAFFLSNAFAQKGIELDLGLASPNKGFFGARFLPNENWSIGLLLGSIGLNSMDLGFAYSYHFYGQSGPYVYQSHHWLKNESMRVIGNDGPIYIEDDQGNVIEVRPFVWEKSTKHVWEINTGLGLQYLWNSGILAYAEVGVPIYAANGKYYSTYDDGFPNNDNLFSIRLGFGVGYIFKL